MSDLAELLERVKAATGPDRLIDADLFFELDPEFPSGSMQMVAAIDPATFATGPYTHVIAMPYTASIDAALALIERVLPGWSCGFDAGPKTRLAFVDRHDYTDRMFGARYTAEAPSICLAILAAALAALIASEPRL